MSHFHPSSSTPRQRWGIGRAHGKAILIGEHSVVHGAPAIAVPLYDLAVEATFDELEPGFLDTDLFTGPLRDAPERLGPSVMALRRAAGTFELDLDELRLRVRSTIPHERGLGSSAAVATAITRAAASFANVDLRREELFELVQSAERVAHGTPSGLDAHTVSATSAVRFHNGNLSRVEVARPFTLVVADSGQPGRTSVAVQHVRALLDAHPQIHRPHIATLANLTETVQRALGEGDTAALGEALNDAHTVLRALEVSSPTLDHLVMTARSAGAVGAKMTGGGMGGCVISLAPSEAHAKHIARSLRDAGASRAWVSSLSSVTTGSIPVKELQ